MTDPQQPASTESPLPRSLRRYHLQTGSHPEIKACIFISGPQNGDQVDDCVLSLLDRPGIKSVSIVFDHGFGERIEIYQRMNNE